MFGCGFPFAAESKFCAGCGRKLGTAAVPAQASAERPRFPVWAMVIAGLAALYLIGFLASSPAGHAKDQPSEDAKVDAAKEARFQMALGGAIMLRKTMRDPDSFKISSAWVPQDDKAVCYQYRARNGFGGMDGSWAVLSNESFLQPGDSGFESSWSGHCKGQSGHQMADDVTEALREYDEQHAH